jgi:poly(3-hydroxybutyrate) depolymerase
LEASVDRFFLSSHGRLPQDIVMILSASRSIFVTAAAVLLCAVGISAQAASSAGTLQYSSSTYNTAYNAGTVTVTLNRVGGSTGAVRVGLNTHAGTALNGVNFVGVDQWVDWAAGDAAPKTVSIAILNHGAFSGSLGFSLGLSGESGAGLGSPATANVNISGTSAAPSAGTLQYSSSTYNTAYNAGTVTVTLDRVGGSIGAVRVGLNTHAGTALNGVNFIGVNQWVDWAAGDAAPKTVSIAILNHGSFSGSLGFSLALSGESGAGLGSPATAKVNISGTSAAPSAGTLQYSSSTYNTAYNAGTVTVTLDRVGGSTGAVRVGLNTHAGTALNGVNFIGVNQWVDWAAGDAAPKTVSIAILNHGAFSGSLGFSLALSGESGAGLGSPATAEVNISGASLVGPPSAGNLELSAASYSAAQSAKSVSVKVTRTAGSSGAASVQYSTTNGTAHSGTDYTSTSGALGWASGDTSVKTIAVPLLSPAAYSGTKSLTLGLSNPTGASLSTPNSAAINITGTGATSGCAIQSAKTGTYTMTTTDGAGRTRTFLIDVPAAYNPNNAYPLIAVYHGAGGTSSQSYDWGLQNGAAAGNGIFVFPQGIAYKSSGVGWDDTTNGYDLPFFDNMVKEVKAAYCINSDRIFAAGFSWGGDFVTALTCNRGDIIRALAVNSATDEYGDNSNYKTYADLPCSSSTHSAMRYEHAVGGDSAYPAPDFATTSSLYEYLNGCAATSTPVQSSTPVMTCVSHNSCSSEFIECAFNANIGHTLPPNWATDTWKFFQGFD